MNRGDFIFSVSRELGLDDTVGVDERTLMDKWANDAVVDVLIETHFYIQIGDQALTAGTSEYRLDSNILAIDDGRGSTPAGIGPYELISLREMIEYQSAQPVGSGMRKYIAIQGSLMVVAPTPDVNEVLRFFYVPRPTKMTSDAHDPSNATYGGIPEEYHRAIEYYMIWRAAEYDDKGGGFFRGHAFAPGSVFKDYYEAELGKIRKHKRKLEGRTLRPARVGYPGTRRPTGFARNDIYPGPSR
jgi:hypothetical protein